MVGDQITITAQTYCGPVTRSYTITEYTDLTTVSAQAAADWARRGWKARAVVRGVRGAVKMALQAIKDDAWHIV